MKDVKRGLSPVAIGALVLVVVGCGATATTPPTVGPADFSFALMSFAPLPTFALTTPAPTATVAPPLWGVDSQGIPLPPPDASGVDQSLVTAAPVGGVPDAVAVLFTVPASTSACVSVYVFVQVVVAAGASVETGQETVPTFGSLTPTLVNVTLPVFFTRNE